MLLFGFEDTLRLVFTMFVNISRLHTLQVMGASFTLMACYRSVDDTRIIVIWIAFRCSLPDYDFFP